MLSLNTHDANFYEILSELLAHYQHNLDNYQAALACLDKPKFIQALQNFVRETSCHSQALTELLQATGQALPEAGLHKWFNLCKVHCTSLMGDKAILKALSTHETKLHLSLARAIEHPDAEARAQTLLQQHLSDIKQHQHWLQRTLTDLETSERAV